MLEIVYTSITGIKQFSKQYGCKVEVEVGVASEPEEGSGSLFPTSSSLTNGC